MSTEMSLLGLSLAEYDLFLFFILRHCLSILVLVCLKLLGSSNPPASALKCWNHRYASCGLAKGCVLVLASKIFYCELTTGSFDSAQPLVLRYFQQTVFADQHAVPPRTFQDTRPVLCWRYIHQES